MPSETICRSCRRGIAYGISACPHCGSTEPFAPLDIHNDQRSRAERAVLPIFSVVVIALVLFAVVGLRREPKAPPTPSVYDQVFGEDADLSKQPGPFTLRGGMPICATPDALARVSEMQGQHDDRAVQSFIADAANGCATTKQGLRVFATRERYHVYRVRAVGETGEGFVAIPALAK